MNRNANFGPNCVVFGQKILFVTGEIKSFVTHITENPPRHLVRIVDWSSIGQNVQKMANGKWFLVGHWTSNFSGYSGLFELFIDVIIFNVYMLVLFIETS